MPEASEPIPKADGSLPGVGPLADALAAYSNWLGHGHSERASLWVERLRMNEDELARFRAAPTPDEAAYVAQPVTPLPPPASPELKAHAAAPIRDPATALRRAREMAHLNAFTALPATVCTGGAGYLAGVPFAVKDLIGVAGLPRSGGSRTGPVEPFECDAASVAALKHQGAVFVGLANLHELAFGASSANPVFGAVVNPAAPDRIPGGSSGGSAAAVAADIVDLALATDTGGSIRIPAACCGVVGFKPSFDAVSREGTIDVAASLDHVGPIGRTVMDCARAFAALTHLSEFRGLPGRDLAGVRVALLGGFFQEPLDPQVRAALEHAAQAMKGDGARLDEACIEGIELAAAIQFITVSTEAAASQAERLRLDGARLGEDVRVRLEMANFLPGHWYLKAQRLRRRLVASIEAQFARADVLLCPTLRTPAPAVGAAEVDIGGRPYPLHTAVSNLTLPFSLSGMPAIAIPWGLSSEGAPISMQIVGASGHDWQLLEIAQRMEMLAPRR